MITGTVNLLYGMREAKSHDCANFFNTVLILGKKRPFLLILFFKNISLTGGPTVEACFMELRSLLVGAPQGDFRNSKGSEALIGQMSGFGLHLSILLTPFSGLHITYNR